MNYEKLYKDALERARDLTTRQTPPAFDKDLISLVFPELRESEGEKMRKNLYKCLRYYVPNDIAEEYIAWLEKQGQTFTKKDVDDAYLKGVCDTKQEIEKQCEQKDSVVGFKAKDWYVSKVDGKIHNIYSSVDKVEPKFKVGDWITDGYIHCKITEILDDRYVIESKFCKRSAILFEHANRYHLWTIQDAKNGDVLSYVPDEGCLWIMIYWSLYEPYEGHVHYHALLVNNEFSDKGTCCICIDNLNPATKEQCDLLFQTMKQEGYEWDAEKKELKKVEPKTLDANKVIE